MNLREMFRRLYDDYVIYEIETIEPPIISTPVQLIEDGRFGISVPEG